MYQRGEGKRRGDGNNVEIPFRENRSQKEREGEKTPPCSLLCVRKKNISRVVSGEKKRKKKEGFPSRSRLHPGCRKGKGGGFLFLARGGERSHGASGSERKKRRKKGGKEAFVCGPDTCGKGGKKSSISAL